MVDVNTDSSNRYFLLHPDLILPPVQNSGRLFTCGHGKASSKINPILEQIFNNPIKRAHSLRKTFKILYRDEDVDEKAIDSVVGHAELTRQARLMLARECLNVLKCCVELSIRG